MSYVNGKLTEVQFYKDDFVNFTTLVNKINIIVEY